MNTSAVASPLMLCSCRQVNGLHVRERDIMNANGILHVIDGVLDPRDKRHTSGRYSIHGSGHRHHKSGYNTTYYTKEGR